MAEGSVRLDKWLWHARVTRTRTLARKLIEAGGVRLNRVKVAAPSQPVRVGDVLTMVLPGRVLVYEVTAFAERRGPPTAAHQLFADLGAAGAAGEVAAARSAPVARPTARQRRDARALRGKGA
ncbi:MAG: RNA-binding protein S4 [Alphaproteobacteria bacterium]|nr:MAG: RNA-binding protein S4 [Alphaproteobacteria bacterium]